MRPQDGTEFWMTWVKDELKAGRHVKLTAHGWSMFPTLYRGVELEIAKVPIANLLCGSLVAHERDGKAVLHRLIALEKNADKWFFLTQGDSSTQADPLFSEEQYLGQVLAVNGNPKHKALRLNSKVPNRRNELLKNSLLFLATPYRLGRRFLKTL